MHYLNTIARNKFKALLCYHNIDIAEQQYPMFLSTVYHL